MFLQVCINTLCHNYVCWEGSVPRLVVWCCIVRLETSLKSVLAQPIYTWELSGGLNCKAVSETEEQNITGSDTEVIIWTRGR